MPSASISRASRPLTSGTGVVWPQSVVVREKVKPSCDFVVSPFADTVYFTGSRGSFAEKNGLTFFTSRLRALPSRLSLTVYRRELVACPQMALDPPRVDHV